MKIEDVYKQKMVSIFKGKGYKWVNDFSSTFNKCINKWELSNITQVSNLSINFVCYAYSKTYGEVVLKMGIDKFEFINELEFLLMDNGTNSCRVYDHDKELKAMILERIIPGNELSTFDDKVNILKIGAKICSDTPINLYDETASPTYYQKISKAFKKAINENKIKKLLPLIYKTMSILAELKSLDRDMMLLHGDLHHWNVLESDKGFKVIDPHSVIGYKFYEAAPFIINHLLSFIGENRFQSIDNIIDIFSKEFKESKSIISKSVLVILVLRVCWTIEEEPLNTKDIHNKMILCEEILKYIKSVDNRN